LFWKDDNDKTGTCGFSGAKFQNMGEYKTFDIASCTVKVTPFLIKLVLLLELNDPCKMMPIHKITTMPTTRTVKVKLILVTKLMVLPFLVLNIKQGVFAIIGASDNVEKTTKERRKKDAISVGVDAFTGAMVVAAIAGAAVSAVKWIRAEKRLKNYEKLVIQNSADREAMHARAEEELRRITEANGEITSRFPG
jgi:hypothetical protein